MRPLIAQMAKAALVWNESDRAAKLAGAFHHADLAERDHALTIAFLAEAVSGVLSGVHKERIIAVPPPAPPTIRERMLIAIDGAIVVLKRSLRALMHARRALWQAPSHTNEKKAA